MISPDEIKTTASNWWREILQSEITGKSYFPKTINRIKKIRPAQTLTNFQELQSEVSDLQQQSKEKVGYGYTIRWSETNNKKIGRNIFPEKITFEAIDDYLKFLRKDQQFRVFKLWSAKIIEEFPELREWIIASPEQVITQKDNWNDLLKVCRYFKENPRPNVYLRQLLIEIHTKFIEENENVITSLLEAIIPTFLNKNEGAFLRKFGLLYDEPLIRLRFLDSNRNLIGQQDISIPLSQFSKLSIQCTRVFVAENKMNFLTLPALKDTVAVWSGGGFNVKYFRDIQWLNEKEILYWGDIDTHGFHILNQIRSYYGNVKSVMMDLATFNRFKEYAGSGSRTTTNLLNCLTAEETELYLFLKQNNLRLEQEKIPNSYVIEYLSLK